MARRLGRGIAAVNYPTGMNLGGDPTQALIHATANGNFVVTLGSADLGQGLKTVVAQIAAETLGVPYESIIVDLADTDGGPFCMGTFASRGTHRVGNAVMMAAAEARGVMLEVAADLLEAPVDDIETDGKGWIRVTGSNRAVSVAEVAGAANFAIGKVIGGRGIFLKPLSEVDPETGAMDPDSGHAHACTIADVEVDDETGVVTVLGIWSAYEIGRAINIAMVKQQIDGGCWMGISHALFETTEPYFPSRDHSPRNFTDYLMPGAADMVPLEVVVLEQPLEGGPYGAKGIGEMTANTQIPAIANAIHDACGIRIDVIPITPERVLRALDELG